MDELPVVHPPFLPKKSIIDPIFTLVLDLDETLIHFVNPAEQAKDPDNLADNIAEQDEDDFFYMVRPYCNKFLSVLSEYYEIVIFTAAMQDYADWILAGID